MSLNAYRQTQSRTETHRASEYRLMGQVTHDLIDARERQLAGGELMQALHRNRAVWTVFGTLCAAPENQLPVDLRARIVSLALWVDRHTSEVMRNGEVLDPLISVNTAIMEGLSVETVA